MIDVETDVFDYVYPFVAPLVPEGCFRSVYVPASSKFPCATLMEVDNVTDEAFRTTAVKEDFAILTYEANAYAMSKSECRAVISALDEGMTQLGFTRATLQFVPNLADSTIWRCVARYTAKVDRNKIIYRRA